VFVGDGRLRTHLMQEAARCAPGRVLFTGVVGRDDVYRNLAYADVYVSMSHSKRLRVAVPRGDGLPRSGRSVGHLLPPGNRGIRGLRSAHVAGRRVWGCAGGRAVAADAASGSRRDRRPLSSARCRPIQRPGDDPPVRARVPGGCATSMGTYGTGPTS
jgi:hypothetical protein